MKALSQCFAKFVFIYFSNAKWLEMIELQLVVVFVVFTFIKEK